MKTILSSLSDKQAVKELRLFSIASLVCSVTGLIVFWWLGIVGIGLGIRAMLLSKHKGNEANKDKQKYFTLAVVGLIVGLADVLLFMLSS